MDPLAVLREIVEENMDRLIVARLEEDLELVYGMDAELEAALRRVIKFLAVAPESYDSHESGESYEN